MTLSGAADWNSASWIARQSVQPPARRTTAQRVLLSGGGHGWPSGPSLVTARTMMIAGFPSRAGEQVERDARGVRRRCWYQQSSARSSSEILLHPEVRSFINGMA
jgi:hypothetical protein